jgi:hypothetical protein
MAKLLLMTFAIDSPCYLFYEIVLYSAQIEIKSYLQESLSFSLFKKLKDTDVQFIELLIFSVFVVNKVTNDKTNQVHKVGIEVPSP